MTYSEKLIGWGGLIAVLYAVYQVARYVQVKLYMKKYDCAEPVIPKSRFFGTSLTYEGLQLKKIGKHIDWSADQYKTYNANTLSFTFLGSKIYLTKNPANIKAMLATKFDDFDLGTRHRNFYPLLGDGIFTLDGEGWKHSRAMLRPQFARLQISQTDNLEHHLQFFAKHVQNAKGATIDIQDLFFKLTVDTATEFLFGESVAALQDASIGCDAGFDFDGRDNFASAFSTAQTYLSTRSWLNNLDFLVSSKHFYDTCKQVQKFPNYYVNKALAASPEELEKLSNGKYVFLYELVKETRDPKILQDQLLNILLAGRDTTAGLLSFTFFELAKHTDVWEKLKTEVYEHFGKSKDNISFETLKKCKYLQHVLNEVLRLYPSVPMNFRVANKDTTLPAGGGPDGSKKVFVAKGDKVAYNIYATQRLEEYYGKDAAIFRPDRWKENPKLGTDWEFLPFNGGPRICLGQQFALTEAGYTIVRLAQLFPNLESRDDSPDPCLKNSQLTMSHFNGVLISIY